MSGFAWGIIAGAVGCSALWAVAAVIAYRRFGLLTERARQAERLAELGTLTGGLAHEIKNPLSTVQLNLQLLREDLPPGQESAKLFSRLATVQKETGRLREILDDFLRYAGKIELDRRPHDVNELLEDLVDFYAPQAQLQRVQLRLNKSPQPITAAVDERLIKQVILNLMINAVQAMPEQGGEIILSARRDPAAPRVIIDVIDTGTGIPQDKIGKLFDAYYSTKSGGTGLGLAIARRVILEHGGRISVTSEPGKGSDFRIELPV
jgi:signal transduction histidine kinase